MKQKIVLYNPQSVFFTMPLALIALGSAVDQERFDVQIIDGRLERDPIAAVVAACEDALCLGVTVLSGQPIHDGLRVTRAVKAAHPTLPTVWGGRHSSLFPLETLAEPAIDVTVQGQGELTFAELLDRFAAGESVAGVAGIAHKVEGVPKQEMPRPLVPMNELPAHDYDLIDVEQYFALKGERQFDYISSTGCFFRCAFCADPFVFKRKWVGLAPERMGEEIESLWRRYQFDDLSFQDETFFTYTQRVAEIAEEFIARGLRFSWTATMRADQANRMDDAALALCVRSGLRRVMIGVESGSQEMMDWLQKDIKVEQVLAAAERCAKHGVGAIFPFIVGFPGESEESVQASIEMVKRLRRMSPQFETPIFYFKPYPGSRITQDVVDRGYHLPQTLEEWADFDYVGSSGPWVSDRTYQRIERFKFYNRFAGGPETLIRWPMQKIARWRCRRDLYAFPVEKVVVDRLKPIPKLS